MIPIRPLAKTCKNPKQKCRQLLFTTSKNKKPFFPSILIFFIIPLYFSLSQTTPHEPHHSNGPHRPNHILV